MKDPSLQGWEKLLDLIVHHLPEPFWDLPLAGAEIGVSRGWTSELLLRTFPRLRLRMVDYWDAAPADSAYAKSGDGHAALSGSQQAEHRQRAEARTAFATGRRQVLAMDSVEASGHVADGELDFAFVDGDHTFDGVLRDLRAWWPKVKSGGLLACHDYQHPRDRRGIWGVTKAVEEFCREQGAEFRGDPEATICWCEKP